MLRIYFTSDDIARTRLATAPDPLWELVLAVHMLRGQPGDLLYTDWRRATATAVRQTPLGGGMGLLSALTPTMGYFPDFLNPVTPDFRLETGLERIRRTPIGTLERDLDRLADALGYGVPSAMRALAAGEPDALRQLTATMHAFYDVAVVPHRRVVDAAVEHDRRLRIRAMAACGVEGLLASLRPHIEYSDGELRVPSHPDQEIFLGGRGLLLVPAYFCVNHPMTMFDDDLPPVLVYPSERPPDLLAGLPDGAARRNLATLLGATRAAILAAIAEGRTTTDLARRIGISAASVSEHTTILRDSGLISSRRDGNRMVHHVTRLGTAILEGKS
ncbi:ArsR/SmtB family transcription factor [Hamadaea tsunoensis]|uniref:ArsR/SmtB family transcription factor n=1 Tax=Hamadaea tsunoensis TaxID=53368 RepID=UPI000423B33D|nr:helix-turn-helix domain-containing protein [Hamadaea tsunoensis]